LQTSQELGEFWTLLRIHYPTIGHYTVPAKETHRKVEKDFHLIAKTIKDV